MTDRVALAELARLIEVSSGFVLRETDYRTLEVFAADRIAALKRVADIRQYTDLLRRDPESDEWRSLLSEITIKESYLFRGHAQFEGLEKVVLPELVEGRNDRHVRVWCAGCARGEEAATLAVILAESEVVADSQWTITATDVDDEALAEARRGLFGRRAMSRVPAEFLRSHFTPRGDHFQLDRQLLERIRFRRLNLVDRSAVIDAGPFDVVFMRNVLIYFRPELQRRVVESVGLALAADGCVFLGPSESLIHIDSDFSARNLEGCFCYRRTENATHESTEGRARSPRQIASAESRELHELSARSVVDARSETPVFAERLKAAIAKLQGEMDTEAFRTIRDLKRDFPERSVVHAIEGVLHERTGDPESAALAYRAALYLTPEIGVLRFLLARSLQRLGRYDRARNEFRSALTSLQQISRDLSEVWDQIGLPPLEEMKKRCREASEEPIG
jgi:chemotaxis methyl-accepting protein methylase